MSQASREWVRRLDEIKDAKARRDIPLLTRALSDQDHRTRAADALADLGAVESAEALLPLLDADDPYARVAAVQALAKLRVVKAASAIVGLARSDQSVMVRYWAADALVDLGDPRALGVALPLLEDPNPVVRVNAAFVLGRLGDPGALSALRAARPRPIRAPVQWWAFHSRYRQAISALRRRAAGKDPQVWTDARWFKALRNVASFVGLAAVCVVFGVYAGPWWALLPLGLVVLSWVITALMWTRGWFPK